MSIKDVQNNSMTIPENMPEMIAEAIKKLRACQGLEEILQIMEEIT